MIRKLAGLLSLLAMVAAVVLAALLVGTRMGGLALHNMLSDEMAPVIGRGDLLYVREAAPQEIAVGMPITYRDAAKGEMVTRRVVNVYRRTAVLEPVLDAQGEPRILRSGAQMVREVPLDAPVYVFKTHGDAMPGGETALVQAADVIGVPVYAVPYLGYAVAALETAGGKVAAVLFAVLLAVMMCLPELLPASRQGGGRRKAAPGEDILLYDGRAARGDDLVLKARGAREGEDVFLSDPEE